MGKIMKIAVCPDCDGRGYRTVSGDGYAYAKNCKSCDGKGVVYVAATNYQVLLNLGQAEMAKFLAAVRKNNEPVDAAWLNQSASQKEWMTRFGIDPNRQ